jgi:hypothetical protein
VSDPETEDDPDFDFADPLKRDPDEEDEQVPGLDPAITIPPEDQWLVQSASVAGANRATRRI